MMNREQLSIQIAKELPFAETFKSFVFLAADRNDFAPSIIAGIISRESAWGLALRPPGPAGTGDHTPRKGLMPPDGLGWGRGLMQIDYAAHEFAKSGDWQDPRANIDYGCAYLRECYRVARLKLGRKFPGLLSAAIASYNCGPGNMLKAVRAGLDIDYHTAHRDYSKDVLDRAAQFAQNGWS